MRWFKKTNYQSFYFLNATQFLGALNDNLFKLLVIYLLIHLKGASSANSILSLAGAIFVIPFLLFSSGAGVLADKVSKRKIIVFSKALELAVMLFGLVAVFLKWDVGAYTALFLMATQSALFGPAKYGIIPEIVEPKMMSKANSSLTSLTYLAIILGTFFASFITDISHKNFVLEALICVLISMIGLGTSFGIAATAPQKSTKKINPLFLYEIYQTLKVSWQVPHLIPAIFGTSFFLFIGAFTQLNIIPFAIQSLGLSEVGGGYLFLPTAVGIVIGAVLAGQLSKDRVEPGISCIAGFFISLFFLLLYCFSDSLTCTIINLTLLGIVGGGFLIPFDSFIQISSPDVKRGQIIAAANFFSFVGVLLAAFCLFLISEELGLSAASGFALMSVLALFSNIVLTGRLSSLFFPFFVQKILKKFRKIKVKSPLPLPNQLVILESASWLDPILLFSCFTRLKILVPGLRFRQFPWINGFVESIRIVPPNPQEVENLVSFAQKSKARGEVLCLFLKQKKDQTFLTKEYQALFSRLGYDILFAHGTKERSIKKFLFFKITYKEISIQFTKN